MLRPYNTNYVIVLQLKEKKLGENETPTQPESAPQGVPTIHAIASGIKSDRTRKELQRNAELYGESEGEALSELLRDICVKLARAYALTNDHGNIEFVLSVQATYMLAAQQGTLEDDALPPSALFDQHVFPYIDMTEEELEQEIKDGEGIVPGTDA